MATFASLTGAQIPPGQGRDSVSFLPTFLNGAEKTPLRDTLIIHQGTNMGRALRHHPEFLEADHRTG